MSENSGSLAHDDEEFTEGDNGSAGRPGRLWSSHESLRCMFMGLSNDPYGDLSPAPTARCGVDYFDRCREDEIGTVCSG